MLHEEAAKSRIRETESHLRPLRGLWAVARTVRVRKPLRMIFPHLGRDQILIHVVEVNLPRPAPQARHQFPVTPFRQMLDQVSPRLISSQVSGRVRAASHLKPGRIRKVHVVHGERGLQRNHFA